MGRLIREQVRRAVETAKQRERTTGASASSGTRVNVASVTNVGGRSHTLAVYSDDKVTIIQRDGETQVIHHRDEEDGSDKE
jgi:hypothetical protein